METLEGAFPYTRLRFLCGMAALKVLVVVVLVSCIESHEEFWTCLDHTVNWPWPWFGLPTRLKLDRLILSILYIYFIISPLYLLWCAIYVKVS